MSLPLQALPSSFGAQSTSKVQSQATGSKGPTHLPAASQLVNVVHGSLSSHAVPSPSGANSHKPVAGAQTTSVQGLPLGGQVTVLVVSKPHTPALQVAGP
jgi:hypothetical protein